MQQKDYYDILGVPANANNKKIKEAYRALAFEYHPDRNKDNAASIEKMKAINEAYAVLSDHSKRSEYDTLREQFGTSATGHYRQSHSEQDIYRGSDVHQIFEEMAKSFGFRGVDDIFKDFYGPGYRNFQFKHYNVKGWKAGGMLFSNGPLSFRKFLGSVLNNIPGYLRGQINSFRAPKRGRDLYDTIYLKPDFARVGGPYPYFLKKHQKKLVVKVPPGVKENQKIRLAGLGEDGKDGGNSGDLYLKIQFKKSVLQQIKDVVSKITFK